MHSPSSSRSTRLHSDDSEFDHQDIDSDMDDFEEFDRQADAACLKSKKLTFDDNVTYIEPDATTVTYHSEWKKKRETARAQKRSWQQWRQGTPAQDFQTKMHEDQLALSQALVQSAHPSL